ncbi:MAG: glycerophosphodiester phosphodiesterase family protein [Pseudomonadota bacterium]
MAASLALFSLNSSWFAASSDGEPTLIAHRGVHQLYRKEGVGRDTCTATRIFQPTHALQENTIPSIRASFAAGADIVEIDVHPTVDGEFVIFHDWTVDCRTDGEGVTREQTLAYLKSLDIAYGYTADGGQSFPFRGEGVGMMPTLDEVLEEFPAGRFLINIKSGDWKEADSLIRYLEAHDARDPVKNQIYGGRGVQRIMTSDPEMVFVERQRAQRCVVKYLLLGWTSYIPKECREHAVVVPVNVRWLLWGWPNRFMQRMAGVGSEVVLAGPVSRLHGFEGLSDASELNAIPQGFNGSLWIEKIEVIGPALRANDEDRIF